MRQAEALGACHTRELGGDEQKGREIHRSKELSIGLGKRATGTRVRQRRQANGLRRAGEGRMNSQSVICSRPLIAQLSCGKRSESQRSLCCR